MKVKQTERGNVRIQIRSRAVGEYERRIVEAYGHASPNNHGSLSL
jgi:hypothetical protein